MVEAGAGGGAESVMSAEWVERETAIMSETRRLLSPRLALISVWTFGEGGQQGTFK